MKSISKNTLRALALGIGLSALAAVAQTTNNPPPGDGPPPDGPPGGGPGRGFRPPPSPLVRALDANGDGIISADEIANAATALLTLDKNHDGQLTPDEFRPKMGPGMRPHQPPSDGGPEGQPQGTNNFHRPLPPLIKALDANGDGIISADEIANAPAALLTLDKNHDGQLTPDEYQPRGPRPHGGMDGMGPGHRPPPPDGNGPPPGEGGDQGGMPGGRPPGPPDQGPPQQ
jgi:Ca2+-binding EF-hand superfamily protein